MTAAMVVLTVGVCGLVYIAITNPAAYRRVYEANLFLLREPKGYFRQARENVAELRRDFAKRLDVDRAARREKSSLTTRATHAAC